MSASAVSSPAEPPHRRVIPAERSESRDRRQNGLPDDPGYGLRPFRDDVGLPVSRPGDPRR
jgi:hypothetical protein